MKTSELIKKVNEINGGLGISKSKDNCITLKLWNGNEVVKVQDSNVILFATWFEIGSPLEKAITLMFEYVKTPLEEREEEKRYLLTTPFAKKSRKLYLYFNDIEKRYYLNDLEEYNQNQFTQKEIDAMPFDTNFFIKEEVK